jgi:ABC-type phosphate/phosphonate transport system substrate-binding protein
MYNIAAAPAMSAEVRQKLSEAILKSTTKEEQDRLQEAIRTGKIPKEYV